MKLLPCRARPHTATTPSGPLTLCRAATASGSILKLPLSLRYTSRRGRAGPPGPFLDGISATGRLLCTTSGISGSTSDSSSIFCGLGGVRKLNLFSILPCWQNSRMPLKELRRYRSHRCISTIILEQPSISTPSQKPLLQAPANHKQL